MIFPLFPDYLSSEQIDVATGIFLWLLAFYHQSQLLCASLDQAIYSAANLVLKKS